MRLTIHYTLTLPGATPRKEVLQKLEEFRRRVAGFGAAEVGEEVTHLSEADLKGAQGKGWTWGGIGVPVMFDAEGVPRAAVEGDDTEVFTWADPLEVAYFRMQPRGAETAFFGLTRLPSTWNYRDPDSGVSVVLPVPVHRGRWYGEWGCKTQYASNPSRGGNENFLRAHLSVIAALDIAIELGFGTEVEDEGGYWKDRSVAGLLAELDRMNRLIAGFVGRVKDSLADVIGGRMLAPIAERPDFERLEARAAADKLDVKFDEAVQALLRLTKRRA